MNNKHRHLLVPVAAAVATALLLTGTGLPAVASARAQDTETVSQYGVWSDPQMANIAINSGQALVKHLRSAEALLDADNVNQARSELLTTTDFADALKRMMPYVAVVDDISNAKDRLTSEDIDIFYDDLLPIYANLDEMAVYAPTVAQKAKTQMKQAEHEVRRHNHQAAAKILQNVADDISATTVYLPVGYVDGQVHAALNALEQATPDKATAKIAVRNALNSLTAVTDNVVIMPKA